MAGNKELKLKSVCFKCNVNKWIVDYKEGCSSKISRTSVCLSCEQAEKIEKLQKSLIEKDVELHRMKDHLIKLEAKVEEMAKSGKTSAVGNEERSVCCEKSLQLEAKVENLSGLVKGALDDIVESGQSIVEIRKKISSTNGNDNFKLVKGKKAAKGKKDTGEKDVPLSNRFAVLSEEEETFLVGDSIVREQTENFAIRNKRKRRVKSFPGGKGRKIAEEVEKLELKSKNSGIIAHAGSNDIYLPKNKVGNTEPLVKDLKRMVDSLSEKTNRGMIVGILPRTNVSYFALSKAIGVNERIRKYCEEKNVNFIDPWKVFVGKHHYFRKDGTHLSEAGHKKLGEILSHECEGLLKSVPPNDQPSPLDTSGNDSLDNSFLGFPKEN